MRFVGRAVSKDSRPVALNAIAYYSNFIVVAAIGLVVNPILLSGLGVTGFGILKSAQRYLDLAGVADGRSTQALKWIIARDATAGDPERARRKVGAAVVVWLCWLPALTALSSLVVWFMPRLVTGLQPSESTLARQVAMILCANVILSGLLLIPDAVLTGLNQGYRSMAVTTLIVVLSNASFVLLVVSGLGVLAIATVIAVAAVLNGGLTLAVGRRHVSWFGVARPTRSEVSAVGGFSGWILAWSALEKLLLSSELIVLGAVFGVASVTSYVFTSYLAQFVIAICLVTTSSITPRLGGLLGSNLMTEAADAAVAAKRWTLAIATTACCVILACNRGFVTLWAGADHYLGDSLNALIALSTLQVILLRADAQLQDTALMITDRVLVLGCTVALSLTVALLVGHLSSSAAAMLLALVLCRLGASLVLPRLVQKRIPGYRFLVKEHAAAALLLVGAYAVGLSTSPSGLVLLLLTSSLIGVAVGLAALLYIAPVDLGRFGK